MYPMSCKLLILLLPLMSLLSACGSSSSTDPPASEAAVLETAAPPTEAAEAANPDLVRVAVATDSPPFVDVDEAGNLVGFDIDLMRAIATETGLEIEFVETFWGSIFKDLAAGKFEVVISAATITPERAEMILFSEPYFNAGQAIVVKQGSDITTPADLTERRVGVQQRTTGEIWVTNQTNGQVIPYPTTLQPFEALAAGEVEAVVYDQSIARKIINENPKFGLTMLDELVTTELYGIAVRPDRPALLATINSGLETVKSTGHYQQICAQWLGAAEACLSNQPQLATVATAPVSPDDMAPTPTTDRPPTSAPATELPATQNPADQPAPSSVCEGYEIQPGDWLSRVASQTYGNPVQYRPITHYTNNLCPDNAFNCINNPNLVQAGWCIYLPTMPELERYWGNQLEDLPACEPADVSGDIQIVGSSTVYPLTERMSQRFREQGFNGTIVDDSIGTGAGFSLFCNREAVDIVNASRPIDATEQTQCQAIGRQPLELQIGTDALVIAVSQQNDFVNNVTFDQLRQLFTTAVYWSEVNPAWPEEPIKRFIPGTDSGTFDYFVEDVLNGDSAALLDTANLTMSEDDELLVFGIQKDRLAVGFFGYAYYQNNQDSLQALAINGVAPRQETADSGSYSLLRPLFIYTTADILQQKPQVAEFVTCYLHTVKDEINDVGYFLPDEEAFNQAKQNFRQAVESR